MATKLGIYNRVMLKLGHKRLASLTDEREERRVVDDIYADVLAICLEDSFWNHALRTVQMDYSPSIDPEFGYQYAFTKPDDWVRTQQVSLDESLVTPLLRYSDESGYWYSDATVMYVTYVSNSTSYGYDLGIWPASYTEFVIAALAEAACPRVKENEQKHQLLRDELKQARRAARSKDAMNEAVGFMPTGTWVDSRRRGYSSSSRGLGTP
jgi:hypothetical protein